MSSMIGTTHKSWYMRMPMEILAGGVASSAFSEKARRTMAVLERAMRNPSSTDSAQLILKGRLARKATRAVPKTWMLPPTNASRFTRPSRERENSTPIVNRRRTTPISARVSTSSLLEMKPRPEGPKITPVARKPTMTGKRNF